MILKYRLEVKNTKALASGKAKLNAVEFQVLDQNFSRGAYKWNSTSHKSTVSVLANPGLYMDEGRINIYLRGLNYGDDSSAACLYLDSPAEAHRVAALIHETLEEWAKSQEISVEEVEDVNVFCV